MSTTIKHKYTGAVLHTIEADTLQGANLQGANLKGANLRGTNLQGADLQSADLQGTNLQGADLQGADLRGANLKGADLQSANLQSANLRGANLQYADLQGADLQSADLQSADLQGANLQGANLQGANLPNASIVPKEGQIIGYKKLKDGAIAKLLIGKNAKRIGGLVGRKCRAEYAKVLSITDRQGKEIKKGVSTHDRQFKYVVGKIVRPDSFCDDIRIECAPGIHFFITKKEAEEY